MIKNITISALLVIILNMLPGNWEVSGIIRVVVSAMLGICLTIIFYEIDSMAKEHRNV